MKFELFGKLRDNDENGSPAGGQDFQSGGMGGDDGMQMGDSLDRTVESMFNQGYSEEEIKQELSGQYSPDEVQNAINSAVASSAEGDGMSSGPEPMTPYQGDPDGEAASPMDEGFDSGDQQGGNEQEQQPIMNQDSGGSMQQQQPRQGAPNIDPATEELIETIVAENMDAIFDQFEEIFQDIDSMKERLDDFEQRIHDLEVRDDEDQQQFVQKVDEMEDHIDSYQSRIGGLEKAFQQVLPSLVDNVQDLTALVQEIKKQNNIETSRDLPSSDMEDMDMEGWD